jgi:fibronectin type 3 domain-containing protein
MKLWNLSSLLIVSLALFSGCGGGSPKPKEEVIDNTLPIVTLTKNGTIVGMKSIAFEWESIKDPRVKGIYIYKSSPGESYAQSELKLYKTINNRFTTHFLDDNIEPDTQYGYAFTCFSKDAYGAQSKTIVVNSLPVLSSVSWIFSVTGMPRTAKIIWRPHNNEKVKEYIVERKTLEDEEWEKIATIKGRLSAEFIDTDLKDNYVYKYRVRVKTYDDIVSTPSQIVKVITKPLPSRIKNISATTTLPKQIKIRWDKSIDKDFSLYYLYRADKIDGDYELIATLHNPTFTDKVQEDGKSYFYRVSAVDKDGLESPHSKISIQGMSLVKPTTPSVVKAKLLNNNKIELEWKSKDPRVKSFTITKSEKQGWFDTLTQDIEGVTDTKFVDLEIKPDTKYTYVVRAVDANGIASEPSIEVEIKTQEMKESPQTNTKKSTPKPQKEVDVESIDPVDDLEVSGL